MKKKRSAYQIAVPSWASWLLCLATRLTVEGQLTIPGATGADLALSPVTNQVIDLSQAATGAWSDSPPLQGRGIYDPNKWAVVFKYSSINISAGVTVSFRNHPSGAPVVWLVNGDVTINGTVDLSGANGVDYSVVTNPGGPGGFRGGVGSVPNPNFGSGSGPGGGYGTGAGGGFFTPQQNPNYTSDNATYGSSLLIPLIGGSGGAGYDRFAGGGGGGAILIAAASTITLSGTIVARGGGNSSGGVGGGSGGGIRLVANVIQGSGLVDCRSAYPSLGGLGRVRLECKVGGIAAIPTAANFPPPNPPQIWPADSAPTIRVVSVAGVSMPPDPRPNLDFPETEIAAGAADILLESRNLPTNATVNVRIAPKYGQVFFANAQIVNGDNNLATWRATNNLPIGSMAIQVRATAP